MMVPRSEGVEEKKEDDDVVEQAAPPLTPRISKSEENAEEEREHGFQAQLEKIVRAIFGTCGSALEAASIFVQRQTCEQWNSATGNGNRAQHEKPPLSIAEELRKLAKKEGRPFPEPPVTGPRAADIPKFLGEDAVHSFEDDNISAISQHTLEEMVSHNGVLHPASQRIMQQQQQQQQKKKKPQNKPEQRPPSPARTRSLSTNSSKEERKAAAAAVAAVAVDAANGEL